MTPLFSFLQDSLEVSRIDDEQVRVTVNLPVDLLPYYLWQPLLNRVTIWGLNFEIVSMLALSPGLTPSIKAISAD